MTEGKEEQFIYGTDRDTGVRRRAVPGRAGLLLNSYSTYIEIADHCLHRGSTVWK